MVEPKWFCDAVAAVKAGLFQVQDTEPSGWKLYTVDRAGIATTALIGSMMKGDSKYGGTNTLRSRRAIRKAVADEDVRAILLHIDSPGGTVAGTGELANDIRQANTQKPVYAHIEDTGASAAYWVASQARRVTATPTSQIGSIGTVAVVEDTSGAAKASGIEVHVVASGPYKGAFVDGAEVTEEHLDYLRELVRSMNGHFLRGVSKGRSMPIGEVRNIADGQVHLAAEAQALGLIDAVSTLDEAIAYIRRDLRASEKRSQRMKTQVAKAQVV
jgi:signal peptide peptidase SppA